MTRYSRPRKPGLVTLGPPPDYAKHKKLANFAQEMKDMRDAWEAHDKTMLLSDNNAKEADRAFEAMRKQQRKKRS